LRAASPPVACVTIGESSRRRHAEPQDRGVLEATAQQGTVVISPKIPCSTD
jgi:hypothetical protein